MSSHAAHICYMAHYSLLTKYNVCLTISHTEALSVIIVFIPAQQGFFCLFAGKQKSRIFLQFHCFSLVFWKQILICIQHNIVLFFLH